MVLSNWLSRQKYDFSSKYSGPEVKIYKGTSQYTSDIRFTIDGNLTLEEFVAVWHAVMYGW
jgi:hypothetical protein